MEGIGWRKMGTMMNKDDMADEMIQHATETNKYLSGKLQELIELDPQRALFVTESVRDVAAALGAAALPPDEYTAEALEILAGAIRKATEIVGTPETCKIARALGDRYRDTVQQMAAEKKDDPWAA